jgi:hypothetical protein
MSTVPVQPPDTHREVAAGASIAESFLAIGAAVLAILALVGFRPVLLVSIATICAGVALLLEGGVVATRLHHIGLSLGASDLDVSGGLGAGSIAGVATIVLGVLAVLGIDSITLLAVASIVIGAGLLLGSAVTARVGAIRPEPLLDDASAVLAREGVLAASGVHVLVGTGAIALGVLALLGIDPLVLVTVSMLSLAGSLLLSGTAVGGQLARAFHH